MDGNGAIRFFVPIGSEIIQLIYDYQFFKMLCSLILSLRSSLFVVIGEAGEADIPPIKAFLPRPHLKDNNGSQSLQGSKTSAKSSRTTQRVCVYWNRALNISRFHLPCSARAKT